MRDVTVSKHQVVQDYDTVFDNLIPFRKNDPLQQARKQSDKQWRESAPDLFSEGLEDDLVLGGALLVADAFAVYSWSPKRRLWKQVRVQVMMVDASNHCCWDPGRDFWRSLRLHLRDEAPFEPA
jgi:hypothetical protein